MEAEGCFSFSELPGHVGALTCNASWVINPEQVDASLIGSGGNSREVFLGN